MRYFFKSGVQSDKTGFIAPREGLAKRRAAQAVKAKQLELCRADMSFPKTNIWVLANGAWHLF